MLATAIIVFREVLEAALIVSIILAATRGAPGRGLWVGLGVVGGLIAAGIVALFAGEIAEAAAGFGQELFNAGLLLVAVVMLGWHNIWMSRHGRALVQEMQQVGRAVLARTRPLSVLAVVVGVAVLREGSETVLFLYGIAAAEAGQGRAMLMGGGLGVLLGAGIGAALYFGLLRIPSRHLFTVTSWMVLLLAAGMAAQAAGYLVAADYLPPLGTGIWDSSAWLSQASLPGRLLHTLIGYDERPAGVQVLFYLATLVLIGTGMQTLGRSRPAQR